MKKTLLTLCIAAWNLFAFGQAEKQFFIDPEFKTPDFTEKDAPLTPVGKPIVLRNGKVLIRTAGFDYVNGKRVAGNYVRLNEDGSFDETFIVPFVKGEVIVARAMGNQKAVALMSYGWGANLMGIARFGNNGVDTVYRTPFLPYVDASGIQSDGRAVIFNWATGIIRLLSNGELDPTFRFSKEYWDNYEGDAGNWFGSVAADDRIRVAVIREGKIHVRGYNRNGQLENRFELGGIGGFTYGQISQVSFFEDGRVFVKDRHANTYSIFKADGTLEVTRPFPTGTASEYSANVLLADGNFLELNLRMPYKVVVATNEAIPLMREGRLLALEADGEERYFAYDASLLGKGELLITGVDRQPLWIDAAGNVRQRSNVRIERSKLNAVQVSTDQVLVDVQEGYQSELHRIERGGGIDSSTVYQRRVIKLPSLYTETYFDTTSVYDSNRAFRYSKYKQLYALRDGSYLVNRQTNANSGGLFFSNTYKIKSDGSVDERFLRDSASTSPLPGDFFLVKAWSPGLIPHPVRFIINGEGQKVDPMNAFQAAALGENFMACHELKDGSVLTVTRHMPSRRLVISRFTANGLPDPGFNPIEMASDAVLDLKAVYEDGRLLVFQDRVLKRFKSNGRPDDSFEPIPFKAEDSFSAFIQPDQKILVWGRFNQVAGYLPDAKMMRFQADGTPDAAFRMSKHINPELITSVHPLSAEAMLVIYKGRLERLILGDPPQGPGEEGNEGGRLTVTAWPNPGDGAFELELPRRLQGGVVEVFDGSGRSVPFIRLGTGFQVIYPKAGLLLVRVRKDGKSAGTKLLVR
ncbi:hypothetical protein [Dyadobacter sp. 676]|uniref:WG repeat-containing protein n=1 Tax=Dyadobacter sp. 676 TaxID=3088362 RepID=A0AAU8FIU7_9BACT